MYETLYHFTKANGILFLKKQQGKEVKIKYHYTDPWAFPEEK